METSWVSTFLKGYTGIRLKVKYEMTEKSWGVIIFEKEMISFCYMLAVYISSLGWSGGLDGVFGLFLGFVLLWGFEKEEGLKT